MLERIIVGYSTTITNKLDYIKSRLFLILPCLKKFFKYSKGYRIKLLKEKIKNIFNSVA